jgi:ABC-type antimicrobial peptide transport system permease subunit
MENDNTVILFMFLFISFIGSFIGAFIGSCCCWTIGYFWLKKHEEDKIWNFMSNGIKELMIWFTSQYEEENKNNQNVIYCDPNVIHIKNGKKIIKN